MRLYDITLVLGLVLDIGVRAKLCSPETCIRGSSQSPLIAHSPSADLLPGSYPSSEYPLSSVELRNLSATSSDTLDLSLPSTPLVFSSRNYHDLSAIDGDWSSAYLPEGWYGLVNPGLALWGSIPNRGELRNLPPKSKRFMEVAYDRCEPVCGTGGSCVPSNRTGTGTCQCESGWGGVSCDECASGFWGPECQPCTGECTQCDDGLIGTGSCLGTTTNSIKGCKCLHGTCTSDDSCTCASGWITNPTSDGLCNTCSPGFFQTRSGDCLVCPLGCTGCTLQDGTDSTPACTSCITPLVLFSADTPTCVSPQTCRAGQYWDAASSTCSSCSPACSTCTGPSTSQCLSCAAPRVNLNGTCVGYSSSTGVCDSSLSGLDGTFVVNNEKSACESCPAGCTSCSIPSFSPSVSYSSLTCSACHDGYLLESGRCVHTCSDGFFLPPGSAERNGTCSRCDDSCSSCITSSTTCTRCPDGTFASNGQCMSTCPFRTLAINGTCLPCSPSCGTCSTPLDSRTCLTCPSDRPVLHNSQCLTHCPREMYFDGTTCQRCDPSCSSCVNSPTTCSSCPDHSILKGGECQATSCDYAMGLGVCMTSMITRGSRKWIAFIVLPLVLAVAGILFSLYIRRQRRKRRLEAKQFGDAIDQVNIRKVDREETDTVKLRLEKVLGLNKIRIDSEDQAKRSRLRELLLPRSRRDEGDIPLVDKKYEASSRTSQYMAPPPPYSNQNDMAVRSEKELIRQSRIIDMSGPAASSSIFASSSTSDPRPEFGMGSGPRPPPRQGIAHARAESVAQKQTVRFHTPSHEDRLDELWPAMGSTETRRSEGWV